MSDNKSTSSGVGFSTLLLLLFITLKLCHVIDWNWWWVLSPLWIGAGLCLLVLLGMGIYYLIYSLLASKKRKEQLRKLQEPPKSKWQERMEQMQEMQKQLKNK